MESTIGASYVSLDTNDITKLEFCYDGNIRALPYHENKKLVIDENQQVEFFGRAYHIPLPPFDIGSTTSIYELWINKSNNLPYKKRREMSHNISVSTYSNLEINKLTINDFDATDYFPKDYEIVK